MGDGDTHDPAAADGDDERAVGDEGTDPVGAVAPADGSDGSTTDGAARYPDPDARHPAATGGDRDATAQHPDATAVHPASADREFDWRGWVLVVAIAVCFLAIPAVIYLYPYVGSRLGLTFYDTYLALPMVPAVVLALLAVWATTRP